MYLIKKVQNMCLKMYLILEIQSSRQIQVKFTLD